MNSSDVVAAIRESGVVGIIRERTSGAAERTGEALLGSGLPTIEVSLTTPDALKAIRHLVDSGLGLVGAGTVLTAAEAHAAFDSGARFVVSPIFSPEVIETARELGMATLPGVATPTEAVHAIHAGADFAKIFPASLYGAGGVKDMLTALPWLSVVPTGGIAIDQVAEYIGAGSVAVGLGSSLSTGTEVEITERISALLAMVKCARSA